MKKITRLSFLLVLGSFFVFSACNNAGGEKKKAKKMAIVVSTLNNPWFVFLAETAAAKAKALGYETKIFDSQNNTATETDNFENILVSDYCAILFNPTDADGSVANVKKAKEAGVPVFCMDREINAKGVATSQILSDGYSGSVEIAKYFVEVLNKKGTYVELLGITGDNNTKARSSGFHSVVDNYPELKMVAQQSADFDRNKGMEVMESMLQAHPDITGVFCGNDAMAMGAYQALVGAGKEKTVKVFGFDGADDAVKSIKENKLVATGMQFPKVMAEKAAQFADEYYNGKRDFAEKIPVAVELVTAKNVDNYIGFGKK
ncbi:substrate-binding domain-containing protein [Ferruginibacter sp.]|nr:D-ribose ABC transporter substrate-binding protein [Ferruginibacter sp.]